LEIKKLSTFDLKVHNRQRTHEVRLVISTGHGTQVEASKFILTNLLLLLLLESSGSLKMSKHSSRKAQNAVPLQSVCDDEDDDDSDQLKKIMQREWNTVDFAGKCKYHTEVSHMLLFY
jgi:hypothetical protein